MAIVPIGIAVAGWFGVTLATSSIIAGMIGGAIVGAAIGGLTALVTGGDILKGMLFGAIGGAITGGVSTWMQGGTMMGTAAAEGVGEAVSTTAVSGATSPFEGGAGLATADGVSMGAPATVGAPAATSAATPGFFGGSMSESTSKIVAEGVGGVAKGGMAMLDDSAENIAELNINANKELVAQQGGDRRAEIRLTGETALARDLSVQRDAIAGARETEELKRQRRIASTANLSTGTNTGFFNQAVQGA